MPGMLKSFKEFIRYCLMLWGIKVSFDASFDTANLEIVWKIQVNEQNPP